MASALQQAIRFKLSPQEAAQRERQYARFANSGPGTAQENELAAFYRRHYRQSVLGIGNIAHASAAQVAAARHAGALGEPNQASYLNGISGQGALGGPLGSQAPVDTSGGPFGVGSGPKLPAMAGTPLPPQQGVPPVPPGGSVGPVMAGSTSIPGPAMGGTPPPAMGSPSGVAMSPLAAAMSFALPSPKSRRPFQFG